MLCPVDRGCLGIKCSPVRGYIFTTNCVMNIYCNSKTDMLRLYEKGFYSIYWINHLKVICFAFNVHEMWFFFHCDHWQFGFCLFSNYEMLFDWEVLKVCPISFIISLLLAAELLIDSYFAKKLYNISNVK